MKKFILTMLIVGSLIAMNVVAFSAPADLTKNEFATFEALSTKYNASTTTYNTNIHNTNHSNKNHNNSNRNNTNHNNTNHNNTKTHNNTHTKY